MTDNETQQRKNHPTRRGEMKKQPTSSPVGLTGREFESVRDLMRCEGMPQALQEKVTSLARETRVTLQLASMRQKARITQKQMGVELGVGQAAVSKLEAGKDDNLTLKDIRDYVRVTGNRLSLMCGKPLTHAEAIQIHADGLKYRLEELANLASQDNELQGAIKDFFGETYARLFRIMALCSNKLPKAEGDTTVRMELVQPKPQSSTCADNARASAPIEVPA